VPNGDSHNLAHRASIFDLEAMRALGVVNRLLDRLNAKGGHSLRELCIKRYNPGRVHALADLKRAVEDTDMQNPEFVYTTYIQTTPERVWQALTEPALTERYWGVTFASDWRPSSTFSLEQKGLSIADPEQVILESEPYRRLAYTWHTFTPGWAQTNEISDDLFAKVSVERRSKVTFDIQPLEQMVKLTVIHDDFDTGSTVLKMVSRGWPRILSGLKTLLETGETLAATGR
jgi:uncharacterized protein YndB with AHSA1/START domain